MNLKKWALTVLLASLLSGCVGNLLRPSDDGAKDTRQLVKNGSLKSLNLSGLSTARTLTLRQPTYVDSNKQLDLVLGGKKRTTTNWIETVHLQELDTRDASVGFEGSWFDQKNDWLIWG